MGSVAVDILVNWLAGLVVCLRCFGLLLLPGVKCASKLLLPIFGAYGVTVSLLGTCYLLTSALYSVVERQCVKLVADCLWQWLAKCLFFYGAKVLLQTGDDDDHLLLPSLVPTRQTVGWLAGSVVAFAAPLLTRRGKAS